MDAQLLFHDNGRSKVGGWGQGRRGQLDGVEAGNACVQPALCGPCSAARLPSLPVSRTCLPTPPAPRASASRCLTAAAPPSPRSRRCRGGRPTGGGWTCWSCPPTTTSHSQAARCAGGAAAGLGLAGRRDAALGAGCGAPGSPASCALLAAWWPGRTSPLFLLSSPFFRHLPRARSPSWGCPGSSPPPTSVRCSRTPWPRRRATPQHTPRRGAAPPPWRHPLSRRRSPRAPPCSRRRPRRRLRPQRPRAPRPQRARAGARRGARPWTPAAR
jgi:hypothetical protein